MSQQPRRSRRLNPATSTAATITSNVANHNRFLVTFSTDLLVSLDVGIVCDVCPAFEEVIRRHNITPFQLLLGLVPTGMPLNIFKDLRLQMLPAVRADHLATLPALVLLSPSSTSRDIKAFLSTVGIDQQKVDSIPANLTYNEYISGLISPRFEEQDLESIRSRWDNLSFNLNQYAYSDPTLAGSLKQVYKLIHGPQSDLFGDLVSTKQCPAHLTNTITSVPLSEEFEANRVLFRPANEYGMPFRNFERTIVNGLAKDLVARFEKQVVGQLASYGGMPVYSPMTHLTNTTGTGKTRSALALGRLTNVLFFKFGGSNGLEESVVGRAIIDFFGDQTKFPCRHRLSASHAFHVVIQRLIHMCAAVDSVKPIKGCIIVDEIVADYTNLVPTNFIIEDFETKVSAILFDGLFRDQPISFSARFDRGALLEFMDGNNHYANWRYYYQMEARSTMARLMYENAAWLESRQQRLLTNIPAGAGWEVTRKLPKLTLVLDEAHYLTQESNSKAAVTVTQEGAKHVIDFYRLVRTSFRFFQFYWKNMVCVTISTVAKTARFNPLPEDDPSYRLRTNVVVLHEPIVLRHTFDSFRHGQLNEASVNNWMDYLFGRERILHIASCGRPLWGAHYAKWLQKKFIDGRVETGRYGICQYRMDLKDKPFKMFSNISLNEAFKKLGTYVREPNEEIETHEFACRIDDVKAVSLLALSVALHKIPTDLDVAELVRVGPMALVDIDIRLQQVTAVACSEGLFNGTATLMLFRHQNEVLSWFKKWIRQWSRCLLSTGEIGELLDRIVVLKALMLAKRTRAYEQMGFGPVQIEKSYSEFLLEPVSLEEFLAAYAGEDAARDYFAAHGRLLGSFVAFSHFLYMGKDSIAKDPYGVAANALSRGAAVVPKEGTPGFDLFIPLVLCDGTISFVYMQIKMGSSYRNHPHPSAVDRSSPEKRFRAHLKVGRPYCYVYRSYNGTGVTRHMVMRARADGSPSDHQPCLSVIGALHIDWPRMSLLIKWICGRRQFKWIDKIESVKDSWTVPRNIMSASNFENYFSRAECEAEPPSGDERPVA